MTKVNAMEMRNVNGGARYATCSACGRRKKLKWMWTWLFVSKRTTEIQESAKMTRVCRGYWSH